MDTPRGHGLLAAGRQHATGETPQPASVTVVYCLWHEHEQSPGDYDEKLLGFYSSREKAEAARSRLSNAHGFKDCPEGFIIDAYPLDADHWVEGYVTS